MPRPARAPHRADGRPAAAPPPAFLTPLIGRARELADVGALLRAGRLVTLVGPGGSGKTRLAAAVAAAVQGARDGSFAWVELAPLSDPELLAAHVAGVLGVREAPGTPAIDALAAAMSSRPALLVLDNCEHLIEACAAVAGELLRRCAALRVLATSRQALGVSGERAFIVPPLALPAPGEEERADACSAIQLFVERAREKVSTFALTEGNRAAVIRICRRLDGMPLAIELAAARVSVLPPEQLASGLDDAFTVLASGARGSFPRHRTLRALIDWSYRLLSPGERHLFERLSVFQGGFRLESAEEVVAFGELHRREVLDLLAGLVDKSLVTMQERGGAARYALLETVRQYAGERLRGADAGDGGEPREPPDAAPDEPRADAAALERRHALHYLRLAEEAAARMHEARQLEWLARLDAEHDNLRAALRHALACGDAELALRFCVALRGFWRIRGHLSEGRRWLNEVLAANAREGALDGALDGLRARALLGAGVLARRLGLQEEFRARVAEGEAIARHVGDPAILAEALTLRGMQLRDAGDPAAARTCLDEAIALWRGIGESWGLTIALSTRSAIANAEGERQLARALREEAAEVSREARDREGEAIALVGLGELARLEGDVERASVHYDRGMTLFRELGDSWHVAAILHNQGWLAAESGRHTEARQAFATCLEMFDGERSIILPPCLVGLSRLLVAAGDPEYAAVVFASAVTAMGRERMRPAGADARSFERTREAIERALPPGVLERAWATGAATRPIEHVRPVLDRLERGAPEPAAAALAGGDAERGRRSRPVVEVAPAAAPRSPLRVAALGALEIHVDGALVDAERFGSRKARELLLLLLCRPDGCTREEVGLAFWPEASATEVKNRFHVTLHRLRRALVHAEWIAAAEERYMLAPALAPDFDAARFEAEMTAALRAAAGGEGTPERLGAALAIYRGDFLEHESFGDWHLELRDRLRLLHLDGLLAHGDLLVRAERIEEAVASYRALLARDALHERACRRLMECYARTGRRGEALRLYERLALLLRDELDAEPDAETTALFARLRSDGAPSATRS
ncbi:MAG TPA: BTAD domain-containing putative transcriptional regulator [Gemmatimonadaceae bacterium]|nr:BTAD domain-containing putative transcriptional regulator [Gemmatimonadaceae bacterium]